MMLKTVASFALGRGISLNIARGSVLDFAAPASGVGAIVNAANEGCLGGGGVDGAISDAGGSNLMRDREALPQVQGMRDVRCETGSAVITGPGDYGKLHVPYVVHAVGPAYFQYQGMIMEGREDDPFALPDSLLFSAYKESLQRCQENGITDVGFSLLSAGIFRGERSMPKVLAIGIIAIRDWVSETTDVGKLKSVTLCGFSEREAILLQNVGRTILGEGALEKSTIERNAGNGHKGEESTKQSCVREYRDRDHVQRQD
ncbi:Appr-1-p processing protein [Nitzschia inconspicua]|uniref:Appr-1-p processing protein n=1 Tax=Nitzschia inconspicua TaxID=303405 RepID=A0A9K3LQA5_9STRA|nr:Appr-1-p processing protein [Nitzschia inconspicua]